MGSLHSRIDFVVYVWGMVQKLSSQVPHPKSIDTQALRRLLTRLSEAALALDLEDSPEKAAKISTAIINLTKTIRETESYNQSCEDKSNQGQNQAQAAGSLEERLKGYYPSSSELDALEARLKQQLDRLLPRLIEPQD